MCVYVPTPDVSMFDLTLRFDKDDDAIIAAQKEKVFTSFLTKNMHIHSYKKTPTPNMVNLVLMLYFRHCTATFASN